MKILLAWLGATDQRAINPEKDGDRSPIYEAMDVIAYDEVQVISDYSQAKTEAYIKWLKQKSSTKISVHYVSLTSPTNHEEIYRSAIQVIQSVKDRFPDAKLTYHLSPGTPAMASIWLLLAKTYVPAQLIESSKQQGVKEVHFPFELSAEFMPAASKLTNDALTRLMQGLPPESPAFNEVVHQCAAMKRIIAMAHRLALTEVPILIQGESGTGKELFARSIHRASKRHAQKFRAVNCGAIPQELVDSELFGHVKGSFTGAFQDRKGYFEAAEGGTLFLDEIGELHLASQVRLLRVLQEKEVTPVGGTEPRKINVRIIAATNRVLSEEIAAGRFREDLYYRLSVGILLLPPLRERKGDLSLLIEASLKAINVEAALRDGRKHKYLSVSAKNILLRHSWPGNVRELYNTLVRTSIWAIGEEISPDDVAEVLTFNVPKKEVGVLNRSLDKAISIEKIVGEVAHHYLARAMEKTHGNKTEAANLLGLNSYQTLSNWLKKYKIE